MENDHDALVVSFMEVTACTSLSDAAEHLASCGWRLDDAVNLYFTGGVGSSEEAVRAPIPARSETLYGPSYRAPRRASARRTGWESERDGRRRRRHKRGGGTSGDITEADAAAPPSKKKKTLAELFRPPVKLTYKGGFHDAKVHAAGLSRWLLVNVQASGEFASHVQNRDVWSSDLVAQAVRDNFVLWQVDAGDGGGEGSKVCSYYKLPHDRLPAVLVVDPVTGQLMGKLHGATDPNDVLLIADKFAERKPIMPVRAKKTPASAAPDGKQEPAVRTAASALSQSVPGEKEETETAAKPTGTFPAAAAAATIDMPMPREKVCKLRVRLPDGRIVASEFGSRCRVAALFAFCRSILSEGGEEERPFRLMRFTGGSMEEISDENVSFEELGLNCSTVSVVLG